MNVQEAIAALQEREPELAERPERLYQLVLTMAEEQIRKGPPVRGFLGLLELVARCFGSWNLEAMWPPLRERMKADADGLDYTRQLVAKLYYGVADIHDELQDMAVWEATEDGYRVTSMNGEAVGN